MVTPPALRPGDRIAILSPASIVLPEYIDGAARLLAAEGFEPVVMPHAKGPADGSYAASDADRLSDLVDAWRDPSIRAILCARGGYGCNHLLSLLPQELVIADPKWLIGFSDVSALHALSQRAGVVSLHAPMAKHLSTLPSDHYCTRALMRILRQGLPVEYIIPSHPLNRPGHAFGRLLGGNLAVINGLAATPFDPLAPLSSDLQQPSVSIDSGQEKDETPLILFIEDVSEQIYAVERMLIRLSLSGQLPKLAGLIVGHFTEYRPDLNHPDMETMISRLLSRLPSHSPHSSPQVSYGSVCEAGAPASFPGSVCEAGAPASFPVCFGFPAGHTDDNLPLPLGAQASLSVNPEETILTLQEP